MNELSNNNIEEALAKIRAEFEKRNNTTGLEILTSYEEQWDAYGTMSDRQKGWLQKQLDKSWLAKGKKAAIANAVNIDELRLKNTNAEIEVPTEDADDLLDAIIEQKLAGQGKVIIDEKQVAALLSALEELKSAASELSRK
jgi:hypothetical protein